MPLASSVRLSVVIVNWNGRGWIGECLASVAAAAAGLETEVIVVDNHSTDSSAAHIRGMFPNVRLIESSQNLGFGRGAQAGVQQAKGTFIAVANSDVVFDPGSLSCLARLLEERTKAAWVGPKIVGADGRIESQALKKAGVFEPLRWIPWLSWLANAPSARRHDRRVRCERLYGACMMFRASLLAAIGGMPTASFLGGEEQRLAARFRDRGYEVWYEPAAVVHHRTSAARKARWPSDAGILEMVIGVNGAMRETLSRSRFVVYQFVLGLFSLLWFGKGLLGGTNRGCQSVELLKTCLAELTRR